MNNNINIFNNNNLNRIGTFKNKVNPISNLSLDIFTKSCDNNNKNQNQNIVNIMNDNLGYYIPKTTMKEYNSNIIEYLDIKMLEIDNINSYDKYLFQINHTLSEKIKNIHYMDIYKVIIPRYPILLKKSLNILDMIDIHYFITNINNFSNGNDYKYNNIEYNIHNIYKKNDMIYINYSINKNFLISYEIIINDNILIEYNKYYKLADPIEYFHPILTLSIEDYNNYQIETTNNHNIYTNLIPVKTNYNNIYYGSNNCFKLYPLNNLNTITKLKIKILTSNNEEIFKNIYNNNNFDNNIKKIECNCMIRNNKAGCSCTYIRDKNNEDYKIYLTFKLGIIKNDLLKNII